MIPLCKPSVTASGFVYENITTRCILSVDSACAGGTAEGLAASHRGVGEVFQEPHLPPPLHPTTPETAPGTLSGDVDVSWRKLHSHFYRRPALSLRVSSVKPPHALCESKHIFTA